MIALTLHEIVWCPRHGHPALVYRSADGVLGLTIGVAATDAECLAGRSRIAEVARGRLFELLEALLPALGAALVDVTLGVDPDRTLRCELRLAGPDGLAMLPIHAADGLVLAQRASVPVRIAPDELDRLTVQPTGAAEQPVTPDPLAAFRAAVEALDLSGLGEGGLPHDDQ